MKGIDIGGETTGLITYMRTDGVQIDDSAITQARKVIGEDYWQRLCAPDAPRQYQTKGQERAGSARSHPPDRSVAPPGRNAPPPRYRSGPAL
jgi:DNA topoisomerase-1